MADVKNIVDIVDFEYRVSGADAAVRSQQGLATSSDTLSKSFEGLVLKYISITAAIQAFRAASDFVRGSIDLAIDEVEAANKFMVVFGEGAEEAEAQLRSLADSTNRAFSDLRTGASGLQDMLVPMGIARDEAAELSVSFVELANDLSSFNNQPTAQVLEAMRSALAGQSEPMRRFGVDLRVAAINAELMRMGIEGGTEAATEAEKAHAILNIMYRQTADALGDAERTAGSAANQIQGLNADVLAFRQELGAQFIPIIETMIPRLRDAFSGIAPEIIEPLKNMTWALNEFLKSAGEVQDFFDGKGIPGWKQWGDVLTYAFAPTQAIVDAWGVMRRRAEELEPEVTTLNMALAQQADQLTRLKREEIDAAIAAYDFAEAQLTVLASATGMSAAFDAQIERIRAMREQIIQFREESKGASGSAAGLEAPGVGIVAGGGGRSTSRSEEAAKTLATEKDILALNEQRFAIQQEQILAARAAREEEVALMEQIAAKEAAAYQERMAPVLSIAQQTTDILVSGMTRGFDNIGDQFKNMLVQMAADWLKSTLFRTLFGGVAKGGFFL